MTTAEDAAGERPRIAFLGLGLMGAPMAARLADAGFALSVWNRSAAKTAPLVARGARAASDIASAVQEADIVCLCLTDTVAVEAVVLGPAGVAAHARPGSLIVDFSTLGVAPTLALAVEARERCGLRWLDAPVSGGVPGAESGSLIVLCGGEAADLDAARPVFDAVARRVTHLGPLGAGQAAKLCNQLIVSSGLLAIAEAMSLGRALGVDVASLPEALEGGFADSKPLRIFGPRMAADPRPTDRLGDIGIMLKDVEAILDAAGEGAANLALFERVAVLYRRAAAQGLAGEDLCRLADLYDRP